MIGKPLQSSFPYSLVVDVKKTKGYDHCGGNATKWAANFWMWNTPQQGRFPSLIGGQSALGRLAAELREPELVVAGLGGDRSRRERTLSSRVR